MKNKSKFIIIISIFVILIGLLSTFAYFTWKSTNNDISFTVSGVTVELNDGKDITGANLMPTLKYTSTGNINKPIKIRLKEETPDTVTVNINLKINTIDTGLKDSSFKYTLVSGNTIIKEGNFSSATNNSTINLATLTNTSTTNKLTTTTSTYNLYIWIDGTMDNPSTMMNKSFDFSLDITGTNSNMERMTLTASETIEELDDGTTGDSGSGVYKVTHSAIPASSSATGSEIPAVTDYRYYGSNPNNYICLDMEGGSTCPDKHLYRIIGSIYEEKENTNRIKVIKATPLTDGTTNGFSWDYKVNNGNGSYDNIWATITNGNYSNSLTSGASLMKLLNSGAWWNGTSGSYYNNSTTATNVNFTNYKLSDKAKSYVSTSRYYLGGYNSSNILTSAMYGYERGATRYGSNPLYWDGMVGLMYPSDYGYAAGNTCVTGTDLYNYDGGCKNKDWLWMITSSDYSNGAEWLMLPRLGGNFSNDVFSVKSTGYVFPVNSTGYADYYNSARSVYSARPVFYLNSSASISSGDGTSTAPYILS